MKNRRKIVAGVITVIFLVGVFVLAGCIRDSNMEKTLIGKWVSEEEDLNEGDIPGDSLYLEFKEQHTVSVSLNNQQAEEYIWDVTRGKCFMKSDELNIVADINKDGTLLVHYTDGRNLYAIPCVKAE